MLLFGNIRMRFETKTALQFRNNFFILKSLLVDKKHVFYRYGFEEYDHGKVCFQSQPIVAKQHILFPISF